MLVNLNIIKLKNRLLVRLVLDFLLNLLYPHEVVVHVILFVDLLGIIKFTFHLVFKTFHVFCFKPFYLL